MLTKSDYNFLLNLIGLMGNQLNEQLNNTDNKYIEEMIKKEIIELANIKIKLEKTV